MEFDFSKTSHTCIYVVNIMEFLLHLCAALTRRKSALRVGRHQMHQAAADSAACEHHAGRCARRGGEAVTVLLRNLLWHSCDASASDGSH